MKIKNSNLTWYVLHHDFNNDKIIKYNVMTGIAEALHKKIKNKEVHNKQTLKEFLIKDFRYHYWCKSEHEIMVSGLHTRSEAEKIDAWRQLEMNIDQIVEYVNLKCDLGF